MAIQIDTKITTPIFQQIIDEIERLVITEKLKQGDFIPSVRELSSKHAINPNTVSKAFRSLQFTGIIEVVRGKGLRVKKLDVSALFEKRYDALNSKFSSFVNEATSLGLGIERIRGDLEKIWKARNS